jgi:hypothetical protein
MTSLSIYRKPAMERAADTFSYRVKSRLAFFVYSFLWNFGIQHGSIAQKKLHTPLKPKFKGFWARFNFWSGFNGYLNDALKAKKAYVEALPYNHAWNLPIEQSIPMLKKRGYSPYTIICPVYKKTEVWVSLDGTIPENGTWA